ncbi:MAG TPA: ABC transporter substrate-binding protein [Nocardioidaceae bacterium]|nr:ABC transporter substrate-binding protein [Nocardioidaceae bacterium]
MARHTTALSALALVTVLATAACSSGSGSPSGEGSPSAGGGNSTSATSGATSAGFQSEHKGGTLTLLSDGASGTLDPQINYTNQYWNLYQNVYDGLLKFRWGVDGAASQQVVPDLATGMPKVSDGGKSYTFTLRRGIKFSNGQEVTVAAVLASFQRMFKISSPNAGSWYQYIVGASKCLKTPATCTLKGGLIVNPKTNQITFKLTQPDPEFNYQLATPFAVILPKGSPDKDAGDTPLPSTGPYKFASYNPSRQLVMVRNPYFHVWSQAAQPQGYPDKIIYKFTLDAESQVSAIENGQADWMFTPPPADRLNEIGTKYADRVHVHALSAFWYAALNVNIPPFNNLKARQAINWGIDRADTVRLFGGTEVATPVCTILPPGFPGHVDNCQYTKGGGTTWKAPDLAKARKLVQESGTAGQPVTVIAESYSTAKAMGEYLQSLLNSLGYKASLKLLSQNVEFTYIQNTNNKVQISVTQWYADYPAASDFLQVLLSCENFHPHSDASVNISGFCNKSIDAQMNQAESLMLSNPAKGNQMWAKIDQEMMRQSPVVPMFTPHEVDFTSKRVGNFHFSRQFFVCLDQLWVK